MDRTDVVQLFSVVDAGPARWEVRHDVTDELALRVDPPERVVRARLLELGSAVVRSNVLASGVSPRRPLNLHHGKQREEVVALDIYRRALVRARLEERATVVQEDTRGAHGSCAS